jgi:hypothetical protein
MEEALALEGVKDTLGIQTLSPILLPNTAFPSTTYFPDFAVEFQIPILNPNNMTDTQTFFS